MSVFLNFGRDVQGFNAYAPAIATDLYSASISSGSAESVTVPDNQQHWVVVFSYQPGADIWVSVGGTAAAPAGGTFASTTSALLPAQLRVTAKQVISLFNNSTTTQDVGVSFYAVSQ